mgnify:CR=1 FL=1
MNDPTARVLELYAEFGKIKPTARAAGISEQTVRKLLITAGVYTCELSVKVQGLLAQGMNIAEVASTLGKSENTVRSYMPYEKGTYLKPPSLNALRIRKHRQKRKDNGKHNSPEKAKKPEE